MQASVLMCDEKIIYNNNICIILLIQNEYLFIIK